MQMLLTSKKKSFLLLVALATVFMTQKLTSDFDVEEFQAHVGSESAEAERLVACKRNT
jgi:hypothetical protein